MAQSLTRQLAGFSNPADNTWVNASIAVPPGVAVLPSATATAGTAISATVPAVAGQTNWLLGFTLSSGAPATTATGLVTITGLQGGTLQFQFTQSSVLGGLLQIFLPAALPASGINVPIVVSLGTVAGGAVTALNIQAFTV